MRYRNRHIENRLYRLQRSFPSVLVTGARQSGKSTLLEQMIPEAEHVVFDPVIDVGGARSDPELFLRQHRAPIVLDEIQHVPEVFNFVRARIDRQPRRTGQWFLTGSQESGLMRHVTESMAGFAASWLCLPAGTGRS